MNKREQELRQALKNAIDHAEVVNASGTEDEIKAAMQAAKNAKAALDNQLELQGMSPSEPLNVHIAQNFAKPEGAASDAEKLKAYKSAFVNRLKGKKLTEEQNALMSEFKAAMVEGTDVDGGYIVPEDITTTINQLKQTTDNLEQYVTVQPVKTNKGARTLEVRADSTPLLKVAEMGTIQETDKPQFDRKEYGIEDYAGFLPISNDLLADTDQGLLTFIAQWFAKKSKATRNALILAVLDTLTKVDLKDYKGIKKALNVDLDPAFSATIFTNQDGFNYLDQLMDGTGRPLLQPNPQAPTQSMLFGRNVVVLSNKTLATANSKYPFIIGDLKAAVILWDRKQMSLDMTTVGGNTWYTNSLELRAIEREDVTLWDDEAVIYGTIPVPAS